MQDSLWIAKDNYYPAIREEVVKERLFERKPLIVARELAIGIVLLLASVAFAVVFPHPLILALSAVLAGFFSLMLGYVMHDAGHRQCSKSTGVNDFFGFCATFFLGTSFLCWMEAHNTHHANPNHEEEDPDVKIPLVAFGASQVHFASRRPYLWLISHQTWFYIPLLSLIPYSKRYRALYQLIAGPKSSTALLDLAIMLFWHAYYYGGLWLLLGFWPMVLFTLIHQAVEGIFFGMVFAPNHKGMPMIEKGQTLDFFTQQVITSRNFRSNAFLDMVFGGLNYQIEHHLFPNMPRYHLARAKAITERFCKERDIPYYETSLIESYREVYESLHDVAVYAQSFRSPVPVVRSSLIRTVEKAEAELMRFLDKSIHSELNGEQYERMKRSYHAACERLSAIRAHLLQVPEHQRQQLQAYLREVQELREHLPKKPSFA
jgi:fatty acid desaturase